MSDENRKFLWAKGLFNGIIAWVLGFVLYLVPAFVVAIKMGFELGPESDDPKAVSEKISQTISGMYQDNLVLTFGFIILTSLLILWRSKIVTSAALSNHIVNGLLVAVFPLLFSLVFMISTGFGFTSIIEFVLFLGAGYLGGYLSSVRVKR
jgi:hypothetical protein